MSDLRDRIAAAVCNWYYGEETAWEETSEGSRQDWQGCAEAVIEALDRDYIIVTPGTPLAQKIVEWQWENNG